MRILQLEAQVHELGAYNKDLSTQLRKDLIGASEEEEEEEGLSSEPKPVEPCTDNVVMDESREPR